MPPQREQRRLSRRRASAALYRVRVQYADGKQRERTADRQRQRQPKTAQPFGGARSGKSERPRHAQNGDQKRVGEQRRIERVARYRHYPKMGGGGEYRKSRRVVGADFGYIADTLAADL